MTIKLDPSPSHTVVIVCDQCPWWAAIRFGMDAAHGCAIDHEKSQHPGEKQARKAAWNWRNTHADTPMIR